MYDCSINNCSVLFGCRKNYVHDRPVADTGVSCSKKNELSLDEALCMLSAYNLAIQDTQISGLI